MSPATVAQTHSAERLVQELALAGQRPSPELRARVLALGEAAVPALVRVLEDKTYYTQDGPGDGYGCAHAADLLGELGSAEAEAPLLRVLAWSDSLDLVHDSCRQALIRVGSAETVLEAYETAKDSDHQRSLANVLAELSVQDERIFQILLARLDEDVEVAAGCLADYGDARAIEPLSRAFDATPVKTDHEFLANQELIEMREAIERLGGELTPEQLEKYRQGMKPAERFRKRMFSASQASTSRKLGRNDHCWCGSGKKYKRCHL